MDVPNCLSPFPQWDVPTASPPLFPHSLRIHPRLSIAAVPIPSETNISCCVFRVLISQNPVIDWSKYPAPPRAPGSYQIRNLPPIVGKIRRQILLDISVAFGIGMTMGYMFWYGYHVPAVRRRDAFYEKMESEKLAKYGGISLAALVSLRSSVWRLRGVVFARLVWCGFLLCYNGVFGWADE